MFQADHHIAGDTSIVIVADDTDVFVMLLHFRHCGALNARHVYMQSPLKGRSVIDIDATVQNNLSIIPGLIAAHALAGCDTVASYYGIGKGIALKVLRIGKFPCTDIYSTQRNIFEIKTLSISETYLVDRKVFELSKHYFLLISIMIQSPIRQEMNKKITKHNFFIHAVPICCWFLIYFLVCHVFSIRWCGVQSVWRQFFTSGTVS